MSLLFNSYVFIFAFLPIVFFGYFWLNKIRKAIVAKAFFGCIELGILRMVELGLFTDFAF